MTDQKRRASFYNRPTDWVTEKKFERETARLERLYAHEKAQRKKLEARIQHLETTIFGKLPEYRQE